MLSQCSTVQQIYNKQSILKQILNIYLSVENGADILL